ncbi:MAG: alpha/beta hydrolase family protein [Gammaproteobacteria bacterium]|nr:alpha/beta hydrolase family protein [Gammaproteobacteria bacterium]
MNIKFILSLLLSTVLFSVQASDLAREKRLADEIIDSIMDGEPEYLSDGKNKFLSIYMETDAEKPKGAVIIMHGRGYHPNWKDVVRPLRIGLPESGWHTLSIQMPVLEKDAKYYDYVPLFPESFPRIEAAIKFLKSKNIKNIVLVAHSCSVHMSMAWFDKTGGKDIDAYIGIGMGATDFKQYMKKPLPLDKYKIPVLDIYGQQEFKAVLKAAPTRLKMIKATGVKQSEQRIVPEADHYITDRGDALVKEVSDWLGKLEL